MAPVFTFFKDENMRFEDSPGKIEELEMQNTLLRRKITGLIDNPVKKTFDEIYTILDNVSEGFMMLDERLYVTMFNQAAEGILCRKKKEVLGCYLFDVFPELRNTECEESIYKVRREKSNYILEFYLDNEKVRNWYRVCLYSNGTGLGIYFRVITDRKRSEEQLSWECLVNSAITSLSKALIRSDYDIEDIAEQVLSKAKEITGSNCGFVSVVNNKSGNNTVYMITESNSCENTTGKTIAEYKYQAVKNENFWYLIGSVFDSQNGYYNNDITTDCTFPGLPEGHQPITKFLSAPAMIGSETLGFIVLASPMEDYTDGHLQVINEFARLYAMSLQRINTMEEVLRLNHELEDKVLERTKELEAAKDELETALTKEKELNQLKSQFITMISHEYRTPLTVILSSAHLINTYCSGLNIEKIDNHVKKISESVNLMTSFLDNAVNLGKADSNNLNVNMREVNIVKFMEEIIKEMEIVDKGSHQFEILTTYEEIAVLTDWNILKQAVYNLMVNACNYSPENTRVEIILEQCKDRAKVLIKDYGYGISDEDKGHVFEPFYRNRDFVGTISGTGLGLPLTKKYLESIKGQIGLESVLHKGTTFIVTLPLA